MEFRHFEPDNEDFDDGGSLKGKWYRGLHILAGEYYSVDDYELRNGQRAAIGEGGKGRMTDDRDWDRVEEYVQLIVRMQETLRQVDHFLSDKLGYPEDHPVRLSIAHASPKPRRPAASMTRGLPELRTRHFYSLTRIPSAGRLGTHWVPGYCASPGWARSW